MHKKILFVISSILICTNLLGKTNSLSEIESIAINKAPELLLSENKEEALLNLSIADSRMPDPEVQAGIVNVPTDTFNLKQDNMTQLKLGVMQNIPRGDVLTFKSKHKILLAESERYNYLNTKALIIRTVRNEWIDLYYWLQALKIIDENIGIFKHLIKVSESIFASGKNNQHDVFQAQLELSKLESQKIFIKEKIDTTRAMLSEWVGVNIANKLYPTELPKWDNVNFNYHNLQILTHPKLKQDNALISARQQSVKIAEQDYRPKWKISAYYSFRQGDFTMSNNKRTDLIGAQVNFDLPFFTKNKQDKILTARLKELNAAKDTQQIDYKKLQTEWSTVYTRYQQSIEQDKLYQSRLIPEARQFAKATLISYKNNQTDFLTVAKAHVLDLNTILEGLKIKVDNKKTEVALLYLQEGSSK